MDNNMTKAMEQAAAVQKLWMDSFTDMANVWSQFSPSKPPPEQLRKMRSGMLKVLAESWEEFMRTPFFMEMMKNSMNSALDLRRMGQAGAAKLHEQTGIAAKEDIDGILMAIRHIERRLMERMEGVGEKFDEVERRLDETGNEIRKIDTGVLSSELSKITDRVNGIGEKVGHVEHRLGDMENQMGTIHERVSGIDTSTISERVNGVGEKVGQVEQRLGDMENQMGTIRERVSGIDTSSISERVNGIGEKVDHVEHRLGDMENQMGTIHERVLASILRPFRNG